MTDEATRGIARGPGQTMAGLYVERHALYDKYSDIRIDCGKMNHMDVAAAIEDALL